MRVSVFGLGYVGAVSGACLADLGHEVIGVDVNEQKVTLINAGCSPLVEEGIAPLIRAGVRAGRLRATLDPAEAVMASDVSIVSVGTPSAPSGAPSLEGVDAVTRQIGGTLRGKGGAAHAVVVRSTVPPGTTEDRIAPALARYSGRRVGDGLEVCFNPEFLREGSSVRDFYEPPYTVAGARGAAGHAVVAELYRGIGAPFVETDCRTAEAVKYLSNAFHAVKVAFANEAGTLLKSVGVDARRALELFRRDEALNLGPAYLKPGYAFGGSCLPKDLRALLALARARDVELPMLGQVLPSNERHGERAFEIITRRCGRCRVALFGLAFKPGTDDMRESPLLGLAERLLGRGFELTIYDRWVKTARLTGANREFVEREIPHLERLLAPDAASALEGAEVVVVGHVGRSELRAIAAADRAGALAGRTIVDLQGVDELARLPGVTYEGICW